MVRLAIHQVARSTNEDGTVSRMTRYAEDYYVVDKFRIAPRFKDPLEFVCSKVMAAKEANAMLDNPKHSWTVVVN